MIMKKLKLMSSDIDQLKVKAAPRNSFAGFFQANDDTSRGSKRSALLNGNGDRYIECNPFCEKNQNLTLQRLSWALAPSAMTLLS
jgi:hypothetical protein